MVLKVDPGVRHNWGRAEEHLKTHPDMRAQYKDLDEEVVVEEWTDPSGIAKPLFFWNLNGAIMRPSSPLDPFAKTLLEWVLGRYWVPFQLFVIFYALDNYPVFVSLEDQLGGFSYGAGVLRKVERGIEYCITFSVLFWASVVGSLVGIEAVSEDRTPGALWAMWKGDTEMEKKVE